MSEFDHKNTVVGTLPVLPVSDVPKTLQFYTDTLGFTELFRQPTEDGLVVNGQVAFEGCCLMLNYNPKDADRHGGGVYFWIRVAASDIDEYYSSLRDKGVAIVDEIKDQFWGDRSFTIRDQNGYFLAFNQSL